MPNHLLEALPPEDRARLLARCERVPLAAAQVLYEPGDVIAHVHFPTTAFVSLVSTADGHDGLQAGMVGNEGALGYELSLNAQHAPLRTLVQGAGLAWRVSAQSFEQELADSAPLRRVLHRYVCVLLAEFARSGLCHRFHQIEQRLARWLLTTQDCAHSAQLALTHEALGRMLGVRRVGITHAAMALHTRSLIDYRRGVITITDRQGLENAACDCYRANRRSYSDLIGQG
ncbi:Crp/Fnr family transcriptional regulator [Variovorax sp. J22G73]|uniref:Crp/Fnr family transcriptional regulator n=1 Tax=unclassified Variovorax TaxID=663243 RepID=UPI002578F4F2|nr:MULTISPECIES: Crp/Fnr family transcriptional regulator [unclassified Variovorax]MDM0004923.1 Crp/Fnr family transcriptional regulator [Variovorax sp. J22R203]MDM0098339.1 Crp/Fnr family transcriptional regulator [Variovorax sp. J22G73]